MRSLNFYRYRYRYRYLAGLLAVAGLSSCAGMQTSKEAPPGPELELSYDDGQPSERPLLPAEAFEWLIKFEPNLPAYKPLRLRLLVASPGALRLAVYAADAAGRPGTLLRTISRTYTPELTSGGKDGKWVLEPLSEVPLQTGPLFVGVAATTPGNDAARLWASVRPEEASASAASAPVFQRDAEPGTALQSTRLPLIPLLRLVVTPTAPPAPPAPAPASKNPAK